MVSNSLHTYRFERRQRNSAAVDASQNLPTSREALIVSWLDLSDKISRPQPDAYRVAAFPRAVFLLSARSFPLPLLIVLLRMEPPLSVAFLYRGWNKRRRN